MTDNMNTYGAIKLGDAEFERLRYFIENEIGIKMPLQKKTMLESRLQKRLKANKINSFSNYCDFVFSREGMVTELPVMIDHVTTNKTDFFREPAHFDYLVHNVLDKHQDWGRKKMFRVWSSACSSGEEPYTLAITLSEYSVLQGRFSYSILGTDISGEILSKAKLAIYDEDKILTIPETLKKKYFLRSKNKNDSKVRIKPELRRMVYFQQLNLMHEQYSIKGPFEVIFCRNVLIYFEKKRQEWLLNKLYSYLVPDGYLFLGHSETLTGMNLPYRSVAPTVYIKA